MPILVKHQVTLRWILILIFFQIKFERQDHLSGLAKKFIMFCGSPYLFKSLITEAQTQNVWSFILTPITLNGWLWYSHPENIRATRTHLEKQLFVCSAEQLLWL